MPDAAALSNVVLQLKCVDGAVAYLNGMEIFRLNMPTGEVNSTTLALESLSEIPHAAFASRHIDSALLVSGLNVLAVEVHLAAPFSPSLLFDCVLTRNYQPGPPRLWFTWPEDYSIQPRGDVLLSAEAFDPDGQVARVEFFVDDMKFGEIDAPPYQMIVSNLPPNSGRHYARARAVDASEDADSIAEVSFSDTDPDGSVPDDLLYLFGPQAYWNYLDDDADPGPAWRDGPNSARWSSGRAPFALGFDWRTIIDGGPTNARHATIYFWGYVRWDVPLAVGSATMYLLSELADGVIVYVNGVEVLRRNLPLGPIAHTNYTGLTPSYAGYIRAELPPGLLNPQVNWIAVEMHQNLPDSAKLLFDLALVGTKANEDRGLGYGIDAAGALQLWWDPEYWGEGWLEMAEDLAGPWIEVISGGAGGYVQESIQLNGRQRFYRLSQ